MERYRGVLYYVVDMRFMGETSNTAMHKHWGSKSGVAVGFDKRTARGSKKGYKWYMEVAHMAAKDDQKAANSLEV
jgi:hypothetical protein